MRELEALVLTLSQCVYAMWCDSQEYMMQDSGAAVLLTDTPHTYETTTHTCVE